MHEALPRALIRSLVARFALGPLASARVYCLARLISLSIVFSLSACDDGKVYDFHTLQGDHANWSSLNGSWVVINYWAEWCKPCLKEIPELNRLAANGAKTKEDSPAIKVFAFNFDNLQIPALKAAVTKFDIQYPSLLADPAAHFALATPSALPSTIILRPNGSIKTVLLGEQTLESLQNAIAEQ